MTEQTTSSSRGWVVTFAALGINLVLGVLYAWGTMKNALVTQWHWSNTDASYPFAASAAVFAVTMIFAGRAQDRIGPRRVAILGGIMLGLGMIASSTAGRCEHPWSVLAMTLSFGLLGGMGIGLGYSATTPACIKWFPPSRKGLITGIVVSGVGLAPVYMAPVVERLLGTKGDQISSTFFTLGIATIVIIVLLALILANPPAGYVPKIASAPASKGSAPAKPRPRLESDWSQMLATPQVYLLWITFILAAAPGLMLIANAKSIAIEQAPAWTTPSLLIIALSIFNTVGRLVAGYASDRIGRTNTMIVAFVIQAANMCAFKYYDSAQLLLMGASVAGLCYGAIFTLMPATAADFYGIKNLGVNYGILFTAFGVAAVTGSLLGGRVRDLTTTYSMAYLIVAAMLLAAAVLAFLTRPPKPAAGEPVIPQPVPAA